MTTRELWWGASSGALAGLGVLLLWLGSPIRRRVTLADRIAPYVGDQTRRSRLLTMAEGELRVGRLARPLVRRLGRLVEGVLGGAASVSKRLERAGLPPDVDGFRAQQALWGLAGGGLAALYISMRIVGGDHSIVPGVGAVLIGLAGGVVARDQALTRAAERRDERILAEFPAVAEMLALAITAGEGAAAALERVTKLSSGELSSELRRCLVDARAGATLPEALQGLADRTGLPGLARFVDGIVVAVERGTPLAEVMRAQAQDARDASKQQLIELGGRRELAMMVPVVFLVLPVTILFAIWPGLHMLRLTG